MTENASARDRPKFDETTVRRVVKSTTLQHPLTLYPAGLGIMGGLGLFLLTATTPIVCAAIAAGGTFVGAAVWLFNYFGRGSVYTARYHQELHAWFEREKEQRKTKLNENLRHEEVDCKEGISQVEQLDTKFGKIQKVLLRKLHEGELTYSRYLGSAEEVYLSGLKNLEQVVTIRFSMDDKGIEGDRKTVKRLSVKTRTDAEDRTLKASAESIRVYEESAGEVENLLVQNEEALTALDKASAAIAKIDTDGAGGSLELAMEDLTRLAARVDRRPVVEVDLGKTNHKPS